jgi:hypothetical protein
MAQVPSARDARCFICFNFMFPKRLEIVVISMGVRGKPWENHYLATIHKYPLDLYDPLIKYFLPEHLALTQQTNAKHFLKVEDFLFLKSFY